MRVYLPKGMIGQLACPVEANPPVSLVVWTKDENIIDFATTHRLKLDVDGTLLFNNVVNADEGRYTCTPYSELGAGSMSPIVQITVKGTYWCAR